MKTYNFPQNIKNKTKKLLKNYKKNNIKSYSTNPKINIIKKNITKYISKKNKIPNKPKNIILYTKTNNKIKTILTILITKKLKKKRTNILIPIPQYPLYSTTLTKFNTYPIPYYLNKKNH